MVAMSCRYKKYNKGAGFSNPSSRPEPEIGEEENMSKIEEMLKDLAEAMADFEGRLARIEQKKAVTTAPVAAPVDATAPASTDDPAPADVTPTSVCPR